MTHATLEEARQEMFGALRQPLQADKLDYVLMSYDTRVAAAEELGRALALLGQPQVTDAAFQEVETEITAVASAEVGDLAGRAGRAIHNPTKDASPTQVAAAHQILARHGAGEAQLTELMTLEPGASAHALGIWLVAAARLHEEWNGGDAAGIVAEADDIDRSRSGAAERA